MQKSYIIFLILVGIYGAVSLGQEFIKQKTKYISQQQDIELDADIVIKGTDIQEILLDLSKTIVLLVKECLQRVNNYANGEKNNVTKIERTALYTKKMNVKKELDRIIQDIKTILKRLESLIAAITAQEEEIPTESI